MNEFDRQDNFAQSADGIEYNTELDDSFELVRDVKPDFETENCINGVCSINWKPQRHNAA